LKQKLRISKMTFASKEIIGVQGGHAVIEGKEVIVGIRVQQGLLDKQEL
jgi:hypothetical protein